MQIIIIVIFIIVVLFLLWQFWQLKKQLLNNNQKTDDQSGAIILQQINDLSRSQKDLSELVNRNLRDSADKMHESLKFQSTESLRAIRDVTEKLVRLDETNKQVVSFADQLKSLQDILKNPKQRGVLGEYYLENTLKNVLPPGGYKMQYSFNDGTIVDAVVFVKEKIIPIDSKFSLENYNRLSSAKDPSEIDRLEKAFKADLKNRIDETSKYIQPINNTMDFAFMFIPHEAIYYDLLVNEIGTVKINTQDLIEYAFKKNVLIVSPTSFLAFLQTVLQGLRALQIEESAKEIQKRVGELGKHLLAYNSYHEKLGSSLGTVINHYNNSSKEFLKIDKDITRINGDRIGVEIDLIEKPSEEY